MSNIIFIKKNGRYYKVKFNPFRHMNEVTLETYAHLMREFVRASKSGRLSRMINLERRIRRIEGRLQKNPLIKSASRSSIDKNINWLLHHPKELTAKGREMRRKQAVAIALSVWRRSGGR